MTRKPTLHEALAAWGKVDPLTAAGDCGAIERILSHADAVAASPRNAGLRWWMLGGAVAATAAISLLFPHPFDGLPPRNQAEEAGAAPVILADARGSEGAAFALLYTPTTEEEYLL
jgi:hypothetical protein